MTDLGLWTRGGIIFFSWNEKLYKVNGLFEGGSSGVNSCVMVSTVLLEFSTHLSKPMRF